MGWSGWRSFSKKSFGCFFESGVLVGCSAVPACRELAWIPAFAG